MDNLELSLKNIQDQIDSLTKALSDAQNQKTISEVHLQNEQKELGEIQKQLQEMTGLNDINAIQTYISNKEIELESIMNDLQSINSCINPNYTFGENDVLKLKSIIDKYNIPITQ